MRAFTCSGCGLLISGSVDPENKQINIDHADPICEIFIEAMRSPGSAVAFIKGLSLAVPADTGA